MITNPGPMYPVSGPCPDCGLVKAESFGNGEGRCYSRLPGGGPLGALECSRLLVARLRRELDRALARVELEQAATEISVDAWAKSESALVAASRELAAARAVGELERAVVEAAIGYMLDDEPDAERRALHDRLLELREAVDSLIKARAATADPKEPA